jgi:hypothetical protein
MPAVRQVRGGTDRQLASTEHGIAALLRYWREQEEAVQFRMAWAVETVERRPDFDRLNEGPPEELVVEYVLLGRGLPRRIRGHAQTGSGAAQADARFFPDHRDPRRCATVPSLAGA